MGRNKGYVLAVVALMLAPTMASAQGDMEKSRTVAGGGITAAGWMGKVDAKEAAGGLKLEDAKFMAMGKDFMVTTGPATTDAGGAAGFAAAPRFEPVDESSLKWFPASR